MHTFGLMKRGKYKPAANFTFKIIHEVICEGNPHNSGYILEVIVERDSDCDSRYNCYDRYYSVILYLISDFNFLY